MRWIVLATTKKAGAAFAAVRGVEPVAIITPRSRNVDSDVLADEIAEAPGLSEELSEELHSIAERHIEPKQGVNMVEATERAIKAAGKGLAESDVGAVEALRALARKIDAWDQIVEWALQDVEDTSARPAVPQNDNVSISAYLKYCEQLGLSPAGRLKLGLKDGGISGKKAKLSKLRDKGKS